MGQINKGTIASIDGNTARVQPADASERPTAKITIPWHLRGTSGNLKKGTAVVYVEFDDATGLLLGRADGEWGAYLPNLTAGSIDVPDGDVTASGVSLRSLSGYSGAEYYDGEYVVTPAVEEQTLETAGKLMEDDVTITDIPVYDVSNNSGGTTVYIAAGIKEG